MVQSSDGSPECLLWPLIVSKLIMELVSIATAPKSVRESRVA
jgi:hypothetical protein